MQGVVAAVRYILAAMVTTRAAVEQLQGDGKAAVESARVAQRLNVTDSVCSRQLQQAMSRAQRAKPRDAVGLTEDMSRFLQGWFDALLPLDEEEKGAMGHQGHYQGHGHDAGHDEL